MPNSSRMKWSYPAEGADPWFTAFQAMVNAMDTSGFASREDRQLILMEGGVFSFSSTTGILTWSLPLEILAGITGFRWAVAAGSVTLQEGEMIYVDLVRAPTQNRTLTLTVTSQIPSTDVACFIAIRRNNKIYFRDGRILISDIESEIIGSTGNSISMIIPSPNSVTGDVETYIGSVYLREGRILNLRGMIGSEDPDHTATIRLRQFTDSSILTSIGGDGQLDPRITSDIEVLVEDWYDMFMYSDDPAGVSICGGLWFETAL